MSYPRIIDKLDTKITYSNALILGDLKFNTSNNELQNTIKNVKDTIQFNICGGTAYNKGAWIALEGCDNTSGNFPSGSFNIRATNSNGNYSEFRGTPEGVLTWNGREIITTSGGKLNGYLILPSAAIRSSNTTEAIHIHAGTDYSNGAILRLIGNNANSDAGQFSLWAGGNTKGCIFVGNMDGTLTWRGKSIISLTDERAGVRETSDGFCLQWGSSAGSTTVTFPKPFSGTPKVYTTNKSVVDSSCNATTYVTSVSSTSFSTYKIRGNSGNQVVDGGTFEWLAIGHSS